MTRRESLYEDYENALLTLLMEDVAAAEGEAAQAESERLRISGAALPESLRGACERIIRRGASAGTRRTVGRKTLRVVSRVAIVAMVLVLSLSVAFAASPVFRATVARWAAKKGELHSGIEKERYTQSQPQPEPEPEPEPQPQPEPEPEPEPEPAPTAGPEITGQSESVDVASYVWAVFEVAAEGEGLTYRWQWSADGGNTWDDLDPGNWYHDGVDRPRLSEMAEPRHNGRLYRCGVTDAEGRTAFSQPARLTVRTKISYLPHDESGHPGEASFLRVDVAGPGLVCRWQYRAPGSDEWRDCEQAGSATSEMTVDMELRLNGYQYRCVIDDENGEQFITDPITLTVSSILAEGYFSSLPWLLDDIGLLKIYGSGYIIGLDWEVFKKVDGDIVSETWDWDEHKGQVKRIVIDNGIMSVPAHAFENFTAVEEAELSDDLRSIGTDAFTGCTGLKTITFLGNRIPELGEGTVFGGVTATVYYPDAGEWAEKTPEQLEELFSKQGGTLTFVPYTP